MLHTSETFVVVGTTLEALLEYTTPTCQGDSCNTDDMYLHTNCRTRRFV